MPSAEGNVLAVGSAFAFSSVQSLHRLSRVGGHDRLIQQRSSSRGRCEQFWHGQGCPLFDVDHPTFSLPTMASATLQGALKDGLGEAVVARDMPKPCEFPSLDSLNVIRLFVLFCGRKTGKEAWVAFPGLRRHVYWWW